MALVGAKTLPFFFLGGALVLGAATASSCAAGTQELASGGGKPSGGTGAGSSSSAGGAGGDGAGAAGAGGLGGMGGAGGDPGAGGGGAGGSTSVGGGPPGTIVFLAGGPTGVVAGEYQSGAGWTTTALGDGTNDVPAIALGSAALGVGVIRSTTSGEVRSTVWTPGSFTALKLVGASVTTQARPAIAAVGGAFALTFLGDNSKHYLALCTDCANAWNPFAEPVTPPPPDDEQSFGSSPAGLANDDGKPALAFAGSDGDLYDQARTNTDPATGTWSLAKGHNFDTLDMTTSKTPAVTSLDGASDLMIVFLRGNDKIMFTKRTGSTWSAPKAIHALAASARPVGLTKLSNGDVLVAYSQPGDALYFARYSAVSLTWSAPKAVAQDAKSASTPAVAPGLDGYDAELLYVDSTSSAVKHARLAGSSFEDPTTVGGTNISHVAAASAIE